MHATPRAGRTCWRAPGARPVVAHAHHYAHRLPLGVRATTSRPAHGALVRSRSDAAPRAIALWRRMYSAPVSPGRFMTVLR
eukprot:5845349-Prymnesium_polylepis.1